MQTKKADPTAEIVAIVAAVAIAIVTAGAGAAVVGAVADMTAAEVGASVVASVAAGVVQGAIVGTLSSAATQLITTGNLNVGAALESGAVSGITAGLTQGITYGSDGVGVASEVNDPNSLANLAGEQSVGNGLAGSAVTQAGTSTAATLGTRIGAAVADSAISAGVQTIIEGGSFGNALKNNLIGAAAAAGAYAIGNEATNSDSILAQGSPGYVMAHGLLGCAAASLSGNSCAAGAIGAAVSAVSANSIAGAITDGQGNPSPGQLAAITALTMLAGGGIAAALGQNATVAANAAENETLNNTCAAGHTCGTLGSALADTGRAVVNTPLGAAESAANLLFGGAVPGGSDYVPFLHGLMLSYDDPDFGQLVSFLGSLAVGANAANSEAVAGETAGSIRNVNPTGGDMNCVNCVVATDATLRGNPTSALPGGPYKLPVLEQQFGSNFSPASLSDIESTLLQQGNGATGIVYGYPPAGTNVGHVFNAVNQNGTIVFLDGQTGTVANAASFPKFQFMPLPKIGK